ARAGAGGGEDSGDSGPGKAAASCTAPGGVSGRESKTPSGLACSAFLALGWCSPTINAYNEGSEWWP
ncbi:hypothetical protein NG726_40985, partial [Pseudomonas sp. MOB-449]|nr:hypothetical protein [Pseudomonas sp. MOB-449]